MVIGMDGPDSSDQTAEEWLRHAQELVPLAVNKARQVTAFSVRWKTIVSKLEKLPVCLSDLSCHPYFWRNALCKELLQSVSESLQESVRLADSCRGGEYGGKLQMQSELDSLTCKLDLNLKDCGVLIRTGVLGEITRMPSVEDGGRARELLARLQIGSIESKQRALEALVELMREDEKVVVSVLGRSSMSALVQLLTSSVSPTIKEKAVTVICTLSGSNSHEGWLASEGVLPPLVRLVESGSAVCKEKAAVSLQRLSASPETARAIVGHGGARTLVGGCRTGEPVLQSAAAGALRNLSGVPEVRQVLADEGVVAAMIDLLDSGPMLDAKEYAAECLQNLTATNETLRRSVVSEGGVRALLAYLDGPHPQEPAMGALRNLASSVPIQDLVSLGFLPRLAHVLRVGSTGAQQVAASAICRISTSPDIKKMIGESGCIPPLIQLLGAKTNSAREAAAQALSSLITVSHNCKQMKRDEKAVPSLVQLLDPNPSNTARKYAVSCLLALSTSQKRKKLMMSYGAIGYLKKLIEVDVAGATKLLDRLERGRIKVLFGRK